MTIAQTIPLTLVVESVEESQSEIRPIAVNDERVAAANQSHETPQPIPIIGMAAVSPESGRYSVALGVLLGIAVILIIVLVWRR